MSTRYGLYCLTCEQATECATYLPEGLRDLIAVYEQIALVRSQAPDIEISVFGWQESHDILWDFFKEHAMHYRILVIDEYGYPIFQAHMPHERLPIKETDPA